jgi:hypothetical protein
MSSSLSVRICRVLIACTLLLGCSSASWQQLEIESAYRPPKALTIAVIGRPSTAEAAEALESALVDGLSSHGIKATIIPETAGAPDASVTIVKWDPGSRALRWLVPFGSGEGQVVVAVESSSADGQAGIDGTARGQVSGGFFGGSSDNAASAAGHLIADTIATGQRDTPPPPINNHFSH